MVPQSRPTGPLGFRVVGAFKLASGLLLTGAGFGIFRLLNEDFGGEIDRLVLRLHLDPENHLVHGALARLASLDQAHIKMIGVGTLFYAALETVEGIGLILRRLWAGTLTVVATGLLLVPEGYELAHRINPLRIAVLLVNLAILAYVVVKLRQERRDRLAAGEDAPVQ